MRCTGWLMAWALVLGACGGDTESPGDPADVVSDAVSTPDVAEETDADSALVCEGNWAGEACDVCPDNWSGDDCDACSGGWSGDACDTCAANWTGDACDVCSGAWTGDACGVCPTNWSGDACDACSGAWTGDACDVCPTNWSGDACDACAANWTGDACDVCSGGWSGEACDVCLPNWTGDACDVCSGGWSGDACDACTNPRFMGENCDECADPTFTGPGCDECADPTYTGEACDQCADPMRTGALCDEIVIPAGTFEMGAAETEPCSKDEETPHMVTLTRSFALNRTEVTQAEWTALMGNNPSTSTQDCPTCPIETVNWWESLAYCNAKSTAAGLPECYTLIGCDASEPGTDMECTEVAVNTTDENVYTCEGYRLPTEAEWEYAARAGTTASTYNGDLSEENCFDVSPTLEPIAWYKKNGEDRTHPVGEKEANPWGLVDMLGNVYEWVWDAEQDYGTEAQEDPAGPTNGEDRIHRGGSWHNSARNCRAPHRFGTDPNGRIDHIGFRTARTLP